MKKNPKVTIVMAIYNPNLVWFEKQLKSLNDQDYLGDLNLIAWNDSPTTFSCEEIISQNINNFPWQVKQNGKNNGITKVFEMLTQYADGEYISYCDQDDIWEKSKISKMVEFMQRHPDCSACHCEYIIIDENDSVIKNKINKMYAVNKIENQKRYLLVKNFTIGCAMLMNAKLAKKAIPFPEKQFHDVWLALFNVFYGRFYCMSNQLIRHRVHSSNNSDVLVGVNSKATYYSLKLEKDYAWISNVVQRLNCADEYKKEIQWVLARITYRDNHNINNLFKMLKVINIRPLIIIFEILLPLIPSSVFKYSLKLIRKIVKLGIR